MKTLIIKRRETAIQVIISLLILLFVYAASSKLLDYTQFRVELGKSPLITAFAGYVAWSIPFLEIGIALLLAFGRTRLTGLYAAFSLMTVFTAYILYILLFSPYIPCSCGGVLQKMNWRMHFVFNIIFMLIAASGVLIYNPSNQSTGRAYN
jgi:uncharacterized membrane protein YphA (DoxX/SURF4 family)